MFNEENDAAARMMAIAYDPGNWFMFPKPWLHFLDIGPAVVLAYLSNRAGTLDKRHEWFACRVEMITRDLKMSQSKQKRYIRSLIDQGVLETKRENAPGAARLFKIKWRGIAELIDAACFDPDEGEVR